MHWERESRTRSGRIRLYDMLSTRPVQVLVLPLSLTKKGVYWRMNLQGWVLAIGVLLSGIITSNLIPYMICIMYIIARHRQH